MIVHCVSLILLMQNSKAAMVSRKTSGGRTARLCADGRWAAGLVF